MELYSMLEQAKKKLILNLRTAVAKKENWMLKKIGVQNVGSMKEKKCWKIEKEGLLDKGR